MLISNLIPGKAGNLEILIELPEKLNKPLPPFETVAVICHPHPLHEGSMHNKVVTTLARTCHDLHIISVRFNFRGVEKSEGTYAEGIGEIDDCLAVIDYMQKNYPHKTLWLMGFSFGAFIAAKAASIIETDLLVTVAPPLGKAYFGLFPERTKPWILVQSKDDKVIDAKAVFDWYETLQHKPTFLRFEDAGHFFHGKLIQLREQLIAAIVQHDEHLRDLNAQS